MIYPWPSNANGALSRNLCECRTSYPVTSVMYVFTRLVVFLYWIGQYVSATTTGTPAYITEGPVSVTALIGTNAKFHCAGTGNYLVWVVDGLAPSHPDILLARGITVVTLPSSGTVQSNLTVPATSVNNGTTVQCGVSVSAFSIPVISNYSTLTVLPGEAELGELVIHTKSLILFNFWKGNYYSG